VDIERRYGIDGVVPLAVDKVVAGPLLGVYWPAVDLSRKASVQSRRRRCLGWLVPVARAVHSPG
jgi:hypothetical protein